MRGSCYGIVEAGKESIVIAAALGEAQGLDSLHAYPLICMLCSLRSIV